jgi:hypothetical protein
VARIPLYSQRIKESTGTIDVFQYDEFPAQLRQQCLYVISDVLGKFDGSGGERTYEAINDALKRGLGIERLEPLNTHQGTKFAHFVRKKSHVHALDAIELALRMIDVIGESNATDWRKKAARRAIEDFNAYCRTAGYGYAWTAGQLIRVDSHLLHAESVVPALLFLSDQRYKHADAEFRNAHNHWRNGRGAETLVDCLKAFESTMKIIADKRGWVIASNATAKDLIRAMFDNGLFPPYYQTYLGGLRSVLESGVPTPRNKAGGHGAGVVPPAVPAALVQYVLHQTAATILFLAEAEKSLP